MKPTTLVGVAWDQENKPVSETYYAGRCCLESRKTSLSMKPITLVGVAWDQKNKPVTETSFSGRCCLGLAFGLSCPINRCL